MLIRRGESRFRVRASGSPPKTINLQPVSRVWSIRPVLGTGIRWFKSTQADNLHEERGGSNPQYGLLSGSLKHRVLIQQDTGVDVFFMLFCRNS